MREIKICIHLYKCSNTLLKWISTTFLSVCLFCTCVLEGFSALLLGILYLVLFYEIWLLIIPLFRPSFHGKKFWVTKKIICYPLYIKKFFCIRVCFVFFAVFVSLIKTIFFSYFCSYLLLHTIVGGIAVSFTLLQGTASVLLLIILNLNDCWC